MEVLLGTTNPSKVSMFERWLEGEDVHFLTLSEVAVPGEPEETGNRPGENARRKAEYYPTVCRLRDRNDSGLYLTGLPMEVPAAPVCTSARRAARRTGWMMKK